MTTANILAEAQNLMDKAAELVADAAKPSTMTARYQTALKAQLLGEAKLLRAQAQKLIQSTFA